MKTFENDDKLDREKFGDYIYNIIENSNKLKKEESESFTLAIDGSWGSGKSTFIDMFINKYDNQDFFSSDNDLVIIKYNAWENDYSDDAFRSLIYTIFEDSSFEYRMRDYNIKRIYKDSIKLVSKICEKILEIKLKLDFLLLKPVTKLIIECLKNTNDLTQNVETERNNRNKIKMLIKKCIEENIGDKKLVIIIDELDRCNPKFALETLETAKHLFDIPNVNFIFALDMKQLTNSIKTVYGLDIDAYSYLRKFFDYVANFPRILDYNKLLDGKLQIDLKANNYYFKKEDIISIIHFFTSAYELSLRDMDIVVKNYNLLFTSKLYKYTNVLAHELYIGLIAMKYKKRDWYDMIFVDNNYPEFAKIIKNSTDTISQYFKNMIKVTTDFITYSNISEIMENYISKYALAKDGIYENISRFSSSKFYDNQDIYGLLFYPDLEYLLSNSKKKYFSFSYYIREQLEMIEFNN